VPRFIFILVHRCLSTIQRVFIKGVQSWMT
jgi:hypothetical protein